MSIPAQVDFVGWLVGALIGLGCTALVVVVGVFIAFFFESHENRELRQGRFLDLRYEPRPGAPSPEEPVPVTDKQSSI